jgi:hypothetical protein
MHAIFQHRGGTRSTDLGTGKYTKQQFQSLLDSKIEPHIIELVM